MGIDWEKETSKRQPKLKKPAPVAARPARASVIDWDRQTDVRTLPSGALSYAPSPDALRLTTGEERVQQRMLRAAELRTQAGEMRRQREGAAADETRREATRPRGARAAIQSGLVRGATLGVVRPEVVEGTGREITVPTLSFSRQPFGTARVPLDDFLMIGAEQTGSILLPFLRPVKAARGLLARVPGLLPLAENRFWTSLGKVGGQQVQAILGGAKELGATGVITSFMDTAVNERETVRSLARERGTSAAVEFVAKRAGIQGAQMAAFGGAFHTAITGVGSGARWVTRWKDARRAATSAVDETGAGGDSIPASFIAPEKYASGDDPRASVSNAVQDFVSGRPLRMGLVFESPQGGRFRVNRGTTAKVPIALTDLAQHRIYPVPEEPVRPAVMSTQAKSMSDAAVQNLMNRRAYGTNPRAVEKLARERGIPLEEAQQLALSRAQEIHAQHTTMGETLRSERGSVSLGNANAAERIRKRGDKFVVEARRAGLRYHDKVQEFNTAESAQAYATKLFGKEVPVVERRADGSGFDLLNLLRDERGAIALETAAGGSKIVQAGLGQIALRQDLRDLEAIGVSTLMDAGSKLNFEDWSNAYLARLNTIGDPNIGMVVQPRIQALYKRALSRYQAIMEKSIEELPSTQQLIQDMRDGESGMDWYERANAEITEYVTGDPVRTQTLLRALIATAQGAAIKPNMTMGTKMFVLHEAGLPLKGMPLDSVSNFQKLMRGEPATPKINDFDLAFRVNTPQEDLLNLQAATEFLQTRKIGTRLFSTPENTVVVDRRQMKINGFKKVVPTASERTVVHERTRALATDETSRIWNEAITKNPFITPQELVSLRITPRMVQESQWTAIGERAAAEARARGQVGFTSRSYQDMYRQHPEYKNWIDLSTAVRGMPPLKYATPEALQQVLKNEEFLVIGTKPGAGQKFRVSSLKGERPEQTALRHLAFIGVKPEQIVQMEGRWLSPKGKVVRETSYLIQGLDDATKKQLGRDLGQNAIITQEGMIDMSSGNTQAPTGSFLFGEQAVKFPYGHSVVKTPTGPMAWAMEFTENPTTVAKAWMPDNPKAQTSLWNERGMARLDMLGPGGRWAERFGAKTRPEAPSVILDYDPATGSFKVSGPTNPSVTAIAQRAEREFAGARRQHTLMTGEPLLHGRMEIGVEGKAGEQLSLLPEGRFDRVVSLWKSWQKTEEALAEAGASMKIFGALTNIKNVTGNATSILFRLGTDVSAGTVDAVLSKIRGTGRQRFASEALADLHGMIAHRQTATKNALKALQQETSLAKYREPGQGYGPAIPGVAGTVIRYPFRFLQFADEYFTEINRGGLIQSRAFRQAMKEGAENVAQRTAHYAKFPTRQMAEDIEKSVKEALFKDEANKLMDLGVKIRDVMPGGKILFPFLRVSSNLLRMTYRHSPAGLLELRPGMDQGAVADNIGRALVGTTVLSVFALHATNGNITGTGPTDPQMRRQWEANGWQSESVRLPGTNTWVQYRGFEPLATYLRFAGNWAEQGKHAEEDRPNVLMQAIRGMTVSITDQTFLQQAVDILETLEGVTKMDTRAAEKLGTQVVTGFIPTVVKEASRTWDPFEREPDTAWERIKVQTPLRQSVRPRLDPTGRPVPASELPAFLPRTKTLENDPMLQELIRLGVKMPTTRKTFTVRGERHERNAEQVDVLTGRRGDMLRERLGRIMNSPLWTAADDDRKRRIIERQLDIISRRTSRSERRRVQEETR